MDFNTTFIILVLILVFIKFFIPRRDNFENTAPHHRALHYRASHHSNSSAPLGSDPNTYTPKSLAPLGSDPNTYTPKSLAPLGSDPNTYSFDNFENTSQENEQCTTILNYTHPAKCEKKNNMGFCEYSCPTGQKKIENMCYINKKVCY